MSDQNIPTAHDWMQSEDRLKARIAELERRLAESEAAYNALKHDLTATVERETAELQATCAAMREALDHIVSYGMDVDPCPECEKTIEGDSGNHDDSCPFAWAREALSACADARKPR